MTITTGGRATTGRSYWVIDRITACGRDVYRVWQRTAGGGLAVLAGTHHSLEAAKASVGAQWRDAASPALEAWGFEVRAAKLA